MSDAVRTEGFVPHAFAPQAEFFDTTETNRARPLTDAVITVRVIKSFEYRTMKPLVLHVDLTQTNAAQLRTRCVETVRTQPAFKAYRSVADKLGTCAADPDTLKLYTRAHGAKTTNLIINLDHPEWILQNDENGPPLAELGIGTWRALMQKTRRSSRCSTARHTTRSWQTPRRGGMCRGR